MYTVQDLYDDWMAWQKRRDLKQGTLYSRERRYAHDIEPAFGSIPAAEVTPKMVEAWYDGMVKRGSAAMALSTLSQMYSYGSGAAAHLPAGFVPVMEGNPARITTGRAKPIRKPHREVATPGEVSALAAGMPDSERLAVLLAAWCGLRIGEVLGLRRRDLWKADGHRFVRVERQVQARGGGLREETVKTKAGNRDVPVPAALAGAVDAHLLAWAGMGEDGLLFPREQRGRFHLHPNVLRTHFNAARDAHNAEQVKAKGPTLTGFVFHDLRKTALTRVGRAGATGAELMRWGGHADLEAVQIYQRADLDGLARLADTMDADVVVPGPVAPVSDINSRKAS
jgi:integrase